MTASGSAGIDNGPRTSKVRPASMDRPPLLKRVFLLGRHEWWDFLRAAVAIIRAQLAVQLRSRGHLLAHDRAGAVSAPSPSVLRRICELELAVNRAIRYGVVKPKCLARSMAIHRLLISEGIDGSRIRVGVRPTSKGITAHAWVTLQDRIVGDDPQFVQQFTEIADARVGAFR